MLTFEFLFITVFVSYVYSQGEYLVSTLAGSTVQDGIGTNTQFDSPFGIAADSNGVIYIADTYNHRIKKLTADGVVSTFAGSYTGSLDGIGTNAQFFTPNGIAVDANGNIYVADLLNHRIRKISPEGVVSTFAGSSAGIVDSTGTNARFNQPVDVAVDANGFVYVADSTNNRIRKISPEGVVSTLAGSSSGFQDGTGLGAFFNNPFSIAVGSNGVIYVADTNNHRIRKITAGGVVTTLAGSAAGFQDGIGISARFNFPRGVCVDSQGVIYVSDYSNHKIRKITTDGTVSTLAGATGGFSDGIGTMALFNQPRGVSVDSKGSVYVADSYNHRIRNISATGLVSTLAGNSWSFQDDTGTNSRFSSPRDVAVDVNGTIYVADVKNHRIRKITPDGIVTTFAGGSGGFQDGTGTNARFNQPSSVSVDPKGNLYISDMNNHRIRKITTDAVVSTLAGNVEGFLEGTGTNALFNLPNGVVVDSNGIVYVSDGSNHRIRKITTDGLVTTLAGTSVRDGIGTNALFNQPHGVAMDSTGIIYIADLNNHRIRKITPTGAVSTLAGSFSGYQDGIGTNAFFNQPQSATVDANGVVYVADTGNNKIRKITPAGVVSTLAGNSAGFQDGSGTNAKFNVPRDICIDTNGTLYVADTNNHRIRKITPSGVVSSLAGSSSGFLDSTGANARFNQPSGVFVDSNLIVFVADSNNHRIRQITPDGVVSTLAGSLSGNLDGTGTNSLFNTPYAVIVSTDGTIYVADSGNYKIRKITSNGVVSTLAGNSAGFLDGSGTNARLNSPRGMIVDTNGTLYVADFSNNRIRRITPGGVVTTFTGSSLTFEDGIGTNAVLNTPYGITAGTDGVVYFADTGNHRIRKITPDGVVSTFAGNSAGFQDDTGTNARFNSPRGIFIDRKSELYVADMNNHRIRKITAEGVVSTLAGSTWGFQENGATSAFFNSPHDVVIGLNGLIYVADSANERIRVIGLVCPAGYQISTAGDTCQVCPIGTFKALNNSDNVLGNRNTCINCPLGRESNANKTACVPCNAGRYRPSNSFNFCICSNGLRLNTATDTCEMCPIGQEVSADGLSCFPCPQNKTRPSVNLVSCANCPLATLKCNATHVLCPPGYQVASNLTFCNECPDGFINPVGQLSQCSKCRLGSQPNRNRTECVDCLEGTFKPIESLTTCIDCPIGAKCTPTNLTCLAGYTPSQNQSFSCSYCEDGFFKSQEGNIGCEKCAGGFYSSDDYTTCFNCPAGFFLNSTGLCSRCGIGRQPVFNRTSCIDCPANTYKPDDTLYNLCLKCPIGATCSTTSFTCKSGFQISITKTSCSFCSPGYYKGNPGNEDQCQPCPVGYKSSTDRSDCQPCINSYRPSLNFGFCQPCPMNSECSFDKFTCLSGYILHGGYCIEKTQNTPETDPNTQPVELTRTSASIINIVFNPGSSEITWQNFYLKEIFYAYAIPVLFALLTITMIYYCNKRKNRRETKIFGDWSKKGATSETYGVTSSMLAFNSKVTDETIDESLI